MQVHGQAARPFKISKVGTPFINFYNADEIEGLRGGFSIDQSQDGLIYYANIGGITRYDGKHWDIFMTHPANAITGVAVGSDGKVYGVSRDEIGYLAPDRQGVLTYHSLEDKFPSTVSDMGTFYQVHRHKDDVVFWSFTDLVVYNAELDSAIAHSAQRFSYPWIVDGDFYVLDWEKGLMKLEKEGLQLMPLADQFTALRVTQFIRYDEGRFLVITDDKGVFLYDQERLTKWETEIPEYFDEAKPFSAVSIEDRYYAIGGRKMGVVILDMEGMLIQKLDQTTGLPEGAVWDLMLDREKNLWVAQPAGLNQVILNTPFTVVDARHGLIGGVNEIVAHKDRTYVSTGDGLFYKENSTPWQKMGLHTPFKEIPLTQDDENAYVIRAKGDDIIVANNGYIYQVKGENVKTLYDRADYFWAGATLRKSKKIIIGSVQGHLHLVEKLGGRWQHKGILEGFTNQIDFIEEGPDGELWVADSEAGVFKVVLNQKQDSILSVAYYDENHGLPGKEGNRVYQSKNGVIFTTRKGYYTYNKSDDLFEPVEEYNTPLEDNYVFRIAETNSGDIFTAGDKNKGLLKPHNGTYRFERTPFQRLDEYNTFFVTSLNGEQLWIAGGGGFKHYDPTLSYQPVNEFKAFINGAKIITNNDSLLFGGMDIKGAPELSVKENGIRFNFSALYFDQSGSTEFQTYLEGEDDDWSDWSAESSRSIFNLRHGSYVFKVRARNIYGQVSAVDEYAFVILTPWYYTWWAYTLYAFVIIGVVWGIVKINTRRLEKEKKALEQTVYDRTEEIRQQKDEIEEQANRLRELDKVKSRFFANISHELRTPLTLINAPLESLVNEGKIDDPEVRHTLETANRNGVSLLSLVEEILDLAKLDSGKLELVENPLWLFDFLKLIMSQFESGMKRKEIDFQFDFRLDENLTILLDENRCGKIIKNLLSNAMKFTPEGGRITLRALTGKGENILIQVEDTGRGIHPGDLPHIFNRYYQSEQPGTKAEGGTGIGLALAKELAELQGGSLSAVSELGNGSTFTLALPARAVKEETIVKIASPDNVLVEEALKETIDRYTQKFQIERPVLLITEDHPEMRAFVAQTLEPFFEIRQAENGKRALEVLNTEHIDIVISDVMMPVMDGFELLEEIKKNDSLHQVSIVMLTARADTEDRLFALTMGIDDYLTKPFGASVFLARVKNILENRIKIIKEFQFLERHSQEEKEQELAAFIKTHDFSEREIEVLRLLARRMTNPEIADALFISRNTVKFHMKNIFGKLGIKTREEAFDRVDHFID